MKKTDTLDLSVVDDCVVCMLNSFFASMAILEMDFS